MRPNTVKAKWKRGEPTYGAWLGIPSSISAEIVARQGYDYVCVDMQHGAIDYADAYDMVVAISGTDAMPFVRVPWNEFGIIGKVLDAGAMGVIIPMVNSVEEASAAVAACRYAPDGGRSYGPTRAPLWAGADYFEHANEEIACVVMVETEAAVGRLDEIVGTRGVDAVYVGPADLSVSLGMRPALINGGRFEEARSAIAEGCKKGGVVAGMHTPDPSLVPLHESAGYRMLTVFADLASITSEAVAHIRAARGERGDVTAPAAPPQ